MVAARVTNIQLQERQHRLTIGRAATIQKEADAALQRTQGLESQLADAKVEMDTLIKRLDIITTTGLPTGVHVTAVRWLGNEFALTGSASSFDLALRYAGNLRTSGLFDGVQVRQVEQGAAAAPGPRSGTSGGDPSAGDPPATPATPTPLVSFQIKATLPPDEAAKLGSGSKAGSKTP